MTHILYTVLSGDIAGGQKMCFNIMVAARKTGYNPILLSQTQGPFVDLVEKEDIKTYIISLKRTFYFHRILSLIKILKNEKIDLIHSHDTVAGNILIRMAGLITNIPIISHIHCKNHFSRNIFSCVFAKTLDNLTAKICKHIIAVSESIKKDLIDQGYPKKKIKVIYNAIDIELSPAAYDRSELLKELGIESDARIFLHIGRLSPDKGQEDLLEAMGLITKTRDDTYCLFAGEDIQYENRFKDRLNGKIKIYGLEKFAKLLGFRKDIDVLISVSDVVVLPSYEEGLPLVVLEAMKNKKPIVAYATGGITEAVKNGENGYLVEKGDVEGLKNALTAVVENPLRSMEMGERGFRIVKEKFDIRSQNNKIFKIYKDNLINHLL